MATNTVSISKHGLERVRARHLWVYRSDVADSAKATAGEIVRVVDGKQRFVGWALYSSKSQIALRFVSFEDVEINREFWLNRLSAAEDLRKRVVRDTNAFRLVYGESDLLPSLIVDRYADCFVIQSLSQGMENLKPVFVEMLMELYSPRGVVERNEVRVRDLEGLPRISGVLVGNAPPAVVVQEGGVKYEVNLLEGQKTGAFLDQRENRISAAGYARGRALDCFSFEGAFALHLSRGAENVIAVDVSGAALTRAARNAELNGVNNIEFREANVFDLLHEMERSGERFDLINLDPPAFAKNRASVEAALRGYREINLRAIKMLNRGGILVSSTCSYHMSEDMFLNCIAQAASDAGRSIQIIEKRSQARDHPVLVSMPETYYLKCVIARAA
jgi:23S rRNA (cytosine1962-C5)-methyltransferase